LLVVATTGQSEIDTSAAVLRQRIWGGSHGCDVYARAAFALLHEPVIFGRKCRVLVRKEHAFAQHDVLFEGVEVIQTQRDQRARLVREAQVQAGDARRVQALEQLVAVVSDRPRSCRRV
jgi:hypothetical protein